MTSRAEIRELLQSGNPTLEVFNECRDLLRQGCSRGGEWDPTGPGAPEGHLAYFDVANALENSGLFAASEALLLEWWDDFGLRQFEEAQRIYRAVIGFKLTGLYLRWGDKGAALRWALYTHADDILGEHPKGGGGARLQLRTIFGMSESELRHLDGIASDCLQEVNYAHSGNWSQPPGFAEEVIRRFALSESVGTHVLAESASLREFHLSSPYFRSLLRRVHSAKTSKEKGETLESLAFYLFLLLPGCVPRRNLLDKELAFESDIVVRNLNQAANLTAELLGRHFLVECKNWATRAVGVQEVGYFLYRMRLTHASFGVIFSRTGVSGKAEERAARALIRRAFHEDGSICVVVDDGDLKGLAQGRSSFWWMLLGKIELLRFGDTRTKRDGANLSA